MKLWLGTSTVYVFYFFHQVIFLTRSIAGSYKIFFFLRLSKILEPVYFFIWDFVLIVMNIFLTPVLGNLVWHWRKLVWHWRKLLVIRLCNPFHTIVLFYFNYFKCSAEPFTNRYLPVNDFVLVSSWLTLNRFLLLLWCFNSLLRASKCELDLK